jgi:hypothetical protein
VNQSKELPTAALQAANMAIACAGYRIVSKTKKHPALKALCGCQGFMLPI